MSVLKSGVKLLSCQRRVCAEWPKKGTQRISFVVVPVKLLMLFWNVDPKRAMSANGAGARDGEADGICRLGRSWKVDVRAGDIWSSSIRQWQKVDIASN